jgi:hypothetical protein
MDRIMKNDARILTALAVAAALLSQGACAQQPDGLPDVAPYKLGPGRKLGKGPAAENSGIVRSRQWPDLFWMQNDSGNGPRIFPVRRDGSVHKSIRDPERPGVEIGGAVNVDWEAIAVDASGRVIVGDIGNNENDRRDLVLYYAIEPSPNAERTACFRKVFVRYPEQMKFPAPEDDLNYDAEAIFTLGDDVFICTKDRSDTLTRVYRVDPTATDDVQTLQLVDKFDVGGKATGADATADGRRLVILTYEAMWLFDVTDPAHPLSGPVRWLPYAGADDCEAVCFADDETLLLAEEASAQLWEIPLRSFVRFPRGAHRD